MIFVHTEKLHVLVNMVMSVCTYTANIFMLFDSWCLTGGSICVALRMTTGGYTQITPGGDTVVCKSWVQHQRNEAPLGENMRNLPEKWSKIWIISKYRNIYKCVMVGHRF